MTAASTPSTSRESQARRDEKELPFRKRLEYMEWVGLGFFSRPRRDNDESWYDLEAFLILHLKILVGRF